MAKVACPAYGAFSDYFGPQELSGGGSTDIDLFWI